MLNVYNFSCKAVWSDVTGQTSHNRPRVIISTVRKYSKLNLQTLGNNPRDILP